MQTTDGNVGADWKIGEHDTIGATYTFNRYEPTNRERTRVDDSSIKLTWSIAHSTGSRSARTYTYLRPVGDRYNFDPYAFASSTSMPGLRNATGRQPSVHGRCTAPSTTCRTVPRTRPISWRRSRCVTHMTFTASVRGDWNDYDRGARPPGLRHARRRAAMGVAALAADECEHLLRLRISRRSTLRTSTTSRAAAIRHLAANLPARRPLVGEGQAEESQRGRDADAQLRPRALRRGLELHLRRAASRASASRRASRSRIFADAFLPDTAFPPMTYRVNGLTVGVHVARSRSACRCGSSTITRRATWSTGTTRGSARIA